MSLIQLLVVPFLRESKRSEISLKRRRHFRESSDEELNFSWMALTALCQLSVGCLA